MDIDKIINSYQSKVNAADAAPEKVAQEKDKTLDKIKNASALSGLFDNIRTAYDMVSDRAPRRRTRLSGTPNRPRA